jgi:hypothetical protein
MTESHTTMSDDPGLQVPPWVEPALAHGLLSADVGAVRTGATPCAAAADGQPPRSPGGRSMTARSGTERIARRFHQLAASPRRSSAAATGELPPS